MNWKCIICKVLLDELARSCNYMQLLNWLLDSIKLSCISHCHNMTRLKVAKGGKWASSISITARRLWSSGSSGLIGTYRNRRLFPRFSTWLPVRPLWGTHQKRNTGIELQFLQPVTLNRQVAQFEKPFEILCQGSLRAPAISSSTVTVPPVLC